MLAIEGEKFGDLGGNCHTRDEYTTVHRCWPHPRMGPQCLRTPPVSASSIYAAVVYVSGG